MGTPASASTPAGGSIDSDSLRRQREETGQALARAQSTDKKVPTISVPDANANRKRSMSAAVTQGVSNNAKDEDDSKTDTNQVAADPDQIAKLSDAQQPPNSQNLQTLALQPPQFVTGLPPTGSQYGGHINLAAAPLPKAAFERDSPFDRIFRDTGKGKCWPETLLESD